MSRVVNTGFNLFGASSMLYQGQPASTAETAFVANEKVEITRIAIANTSSAQRRFYLYHSRPGPAGTAPLGLAQALIYGRDYSRNDDPPLNTAEYPGQGVTLAPGDVLGVGAESDLTITIYGVSSRSR